MEYKNNETGKQSLLINEDYETRINQNETKPSVTDDHPSTAAGPATEPQESKTCYWVTCGLLAGFCMGTGGALYATCYARLGMAGVGLTGPGTFIAFLVWRIVLELTHKCREGQWLKKTGSRVVTDDGEYKWKNLIPLFGNVFINGVYLVNMSYAWNFAKLGGLNQGLVTTWLSVASVYNVIIFYCVFREKPLPLQYLGIFLIICMIVTLDLAAYGQKEDETAALPPVADNGYSKFANCSFALLLGALSPVLIASKCLIIRIYHNLGYQGFDLAIDANIIQYFIYACMLQHLINVQHDYYTLQWVDIFQGTAAGILMGLAYVFIAEGIAKGTAGPVQALMSTHALHQTTQTALFAGQPLTFIQVAAVFLGLLGVTTIGCAGMVSKQSQVER